MNDEQYKEARTYAWSYFALHADQRIKMFDFFLIFSGLVLGTFPAVKGMAMGTKLVAFFPLLLVFSAFIFWRLDERTRQLVKNAEAALKFLDQRWPVESQEDNPSRYLRLFERDDYLTHALKQRWWAKLVPVSYTHSFRFAYLLIGSLGCILAGWEWIK